jgi:arylsulfatase A-like enzyme
VEDSARTPRVRALALCTLLAACAPPADERANVLWISLDTLRADHLSCYGYERPSSPEIDRLASEGALFEQAWSTTSWTLPAHVSMLTGLPVSAHGICDHQLWEYVDERFELHGTFVSEDLRADGYATAGFYNWKYLEPQFGFGPGFDVWERTTHTVTSLPGVRERWEAAIASRDAAALAAIKREHPELDPNHPSTRRTLERARDWLDGHVLREPRRPFFLFLHLFDVHDPYTPPETFAGSFADLAYRGPIDGQNVSAPDSPVRLGMPPGDLAQLVALYDGEIAWVDAEIGRLLARLTALGLEENTLVVLTADHGEEFFEHGRKLHRSSLLREQLQIPLILRFPGRIAAGLRLREPVDLVDLVPTVHALLGRAPPAGLPGRDLTGCLVPRPADDGDGARPAIAPRTLFSELTVLIDLEQPEWSVGLRRDDEHVIVHQPGTPQARAVRYDLRANPLEEGDGEELLLDSPAGRALVEELARTRAELQALRARSQRRAVGAPLSTADQAELAALGYASGEGVLPRSGADPSRLCMDGCVWRVP